MMMYKTLSVIIMALAVAACAAPRQAQSPAEQAYLDAATAQPTTFSISSAEATAAWERAVKWLEDHATMSIKTKTETMIATLDPPTSSTTGSRNEYGYTVTRQPAGSSYTVTVTCVGNDPSIKPQAEQNAHLLAYFILTGKPTPASLVE
jgi:hypothetical protein